MGDCGSTFGGRRPTRKAKVPSLRLRQALPRKFDYDFSWARNQSGRSERIRLCNNGAKVVRNHKQFFTNAISS